MREDTQFSQRYFLTPVALEAGAAAARAVGRSNLPGSSGAASSLAHVFDEDEDDSRKAQSAKDKRAAAKAKAKARAASRKGAGKGADKSDDKSANKYQIDVTWRR